MGLTNLKWYIFIRIKHYGWNLEEIKLLTGHT